MSVAPISYITYSVLSNFLDSIEDSRWKIIGPNYQSGNLLNPVDAATIVEELEKTHAFRADDPDYLYVFSPEFTVSEAVTQMEDREIPIIDSIDELGKYTIRSAGQDYLYLSPCLDEAANDEYINLMLST